MENQENMNSTNFDAMISRARDALESASVADRLYSSLSQAATTATGTNLTDEAFNDLYSSMTDSLAQRDFKIVLNKLRQQYDNHE